MCYLCSTYTVINEKNCYIRTSTLRTKKRTTKVLGLCGHFTIQIFTKLYLKNQLVINNLLTTLFGHILSGEHSI